MSTGTEWAESVTDLKIVSSRELSGGYSNHNVLLEMSDGARLVLRRYRGDNRCAVEAALARRLHGVVPVAEVVAADPEAGLLLSVFVDGGPVTDGYPVGVTLARIGSVTFDAPGFFGGEDLTPSGDELIGGLDAFVDRCLREGNATGHLTGDEQKALLRYAAEVTPELNALQGSRRLVHADYNPKNLLAVDGRVTAVLDWEFAFSSSPLFDVGNMLRDPRPPGFSDDFLRGFRDGGGELPGDWRRLSAALDLYSLADFLTRPVEHRYFGKAVAHIRELVR
ncbi:phosphotransferase [Actinoplanes sp. NPDC026619]|uniref:phosphotransferase family protein n=1 Tax=Actinoplanes sp. NPDC026619 TaxID=3155798 RepID=UPI0033D2B8E3